MKHIKDLPNAVTLYYHLRKLQTIAKEVAYAQNETDAEYFTIRHLRPELEKVEQILKENEIS